MHAEVEELRPKLKEILYDCAVDIRATKAALYLFDGNNRFELVIEYGFRGTVRPSADFNDPLVDRCGRGRTPFFVNGVGAEPRLSELLYASATDRLLAAPLFSRGKLIGLIDMRDKAAKTPFEAPDVPKAQNIADRLVEVLADKPIFGHHYIALSKETPGGGGAAAAPAAPAPLAAPAAAPLQPVSAEAAVSSRQVAPAGPMTGLTNVVLQARAVAAGIMAPVPESLTENELAAAREVLRSILHIPGTGVAMLSAYGHLGGVQEVSSRSTLTAEAKSLLHAKLHAWLAKRGDPGGAVKTSVLTPFGTSGPQVTAADVQKVFTAPLTVGALQRLYLTVAFNGSPDRAAHDLLGVMHGHLQTVLEHSLQSSALSALRLRIAESLVEPEFTKYPELRRHTTAVAKLAESFARYLGLTPAEVEQARIVALVHDAGMRLLEYDRIYRNHVLTQEELGFLREHPSVGAAMVQPLLGAGIARAVLAHHERFDGRGYPNELSGDEIPLTARLVQLCDAWVAMTDAESYQPPVSAETARASMARASGTQFDPALAMKFLEMLR